MEDSDSSTDIINYITRTAYKQLIFMVSNLTSIADLKENTAIEKVHAPGIKADKLSLIKTIFTN